MPYPLANEDPKFGSWDLNPVHQAYRTYVAFLQGAFADLEGHKHYGSYVWSPDPTLTKINIGSESPMDAALIAQNPAIIVSHPGSDSTSGIIGDIDEMNPMTGEFTYIDRLSGTFSVYAMSKERNVALSIAWLIREFTWTMQRVLIDNGKFYTIGQGIRIGPPLPPGSLVRGGDTRSSIQAVPMSIPYSVVTRSTAKLINHQQLHSVEFNVSTSGKTVDRNLPAIPEGWTIERWVAEQNRSSGYQVPVDPGQVTPLPTEAPSEGQSDGEVSIHVDLLE